jgi:hypothetical protein
VSACGWVFVSVRRMCVHGAEPQCASACARVCVCPSLCVQGAGPQSLIAGGRV